MITIKEKVFNDFFETPFQVYPEDFPFVSELKDDIKRFLTVKNPIFTSEDDFTYFTAYKDGKLAGRITAHIHQASNKKFNIKRGYFGYFDLMDDKDVAESLLKAAEDFLKKRGCNEIIGNFNLTAMQKAGVVTEFYRLDQYTDQIINPLYVPALLEKCGYQKTFPMTTFEADLSHIKWDASKGKKAQTISESTDYTFDQLDKRNLKSILEIMRVCLNDGMNQNPMFVPLTYEEIYFQAKDLTMILDPALSVVCRYKGEPIGAIVCVPDLNPMLKKMKSRIGLMTPFYFIQHKLKRERVTLIFYSVKREFHSQGINSAMMGRFLNSFLERGYSKIGGTWIADENIASLKIAEKFGAKPLHRLHLFKKDLK